MNGTILLTPLIAFLIYLAVGVILSGVGRILAEPANESQVKTSAYASGEAAPRRSAAPGYQPFFIIALFFAILHLGVLIIGSGGMNWMTAAYLAGLIIALVALILG